MTPKPIKSVFFDFDGTIANSETFHYECMNLVLNNFGSNLEASDYFKNYAGIPTNIACAMLVKQYPNINITVEKLVIEIESFVKLREVDHVPELMPYAKECIDFFSRYGVQMGIVTASKYESVASFMKKTNLESYFSFIVTFDDVKSSKPDPESYLLAIDKSGHTPSEIIVFEDTQNGVKSAKSAKLTCCAIQANAELHEKLKDADFIFTSLKEATYFFKERLGGAR